ncbi:unnamed protein product [Peronospora belbahrii]|uniref:Uncharacterized protein n=1 Tax=Peronospora belbahrii TaxID=622444 RepID=A0ABN8CUL3_9STRA|nr:unnamed protein product [Peronospora belbahrii]
MSLSRPLSQLLTRDAVNIVQNQPGRRPSALQWIFSIHKVASRCCRLWLHVVKSTTNFSWSYAICRSTPHGGSPCRPYD